jgi:methylated-DNA-[protein]-cysteine S-methyltransferase
MGDNGLNNADIMCEVEDFVINTPVGLLAIKVTNDEVIRIDLNSNESITSARSYFAKEVQRQINCYFEDASFKFNLKLNAKGTGYQRKVWLGLQNIPLAQTMTYGELASKIVSGARAVGNACRNNPIPLIVPCHRVVSTSGLGGFAGKLDGQLIDIKKFLLVHEGALLI